MNPLLLFYYETFFIIKLRCTVGSVGLCCLYFKDKKKNKARKIFLGTAHMDISILTAALQSLFCLKPTIKALRLSVFVCFKIKNLCFSYYFKTQRLIMHSHYVICSRRSGTNCEALQDSGWKEKTSTRRHFAKSCRVIENGDSGFYTMDRRKGRLFFFFFKLCAALLEWDQCPFIGEWNSECAKCAN